MSEPMASFRTKTKVRQEEYAVHGKIYTDRIEIEREVHAIKMEQHTTIYYKDVHNIVYGRKDASCAWITFEMKNCAEPKRDIVPFCDAYSVVFSGFAEAVFSKDIYEDVEKWFRAYQKDPEAATMTKEKEKHQRRTFSGDSCRTLFDSYSSEIYADDNYIEVTRRGKTSDVPEKMSVPYAELISVTCRTITDYPGCWLVLGTVNSGRTMDGRLTKNPWKDPYQVNFRYSCHLKLQRYCENVQQILKEYRRAHNIEETVVNQSEKVCVRLKELKELYDLGILNDAEYEEKRQKLLSEI